MPSTSSSSSSSPWQVVVTSTNAGLERVAKLTPTFFPFELDSKTMEPLKGGEFKDFGSKMAARPRKKSFECDQTDREETFAACVCFFFFPGKNERIHSVNISIKHENIVSKIKRATNCLFTWLIRISASFIDLLSQHLTHSHHMPVDVFLTGAHETFLCGCNVANNLSPLAGGV